MHVKDHILEGYQGWRRGQRTEKDRSVPASGKRWRKSNLRFDSSQLPCPAFDRFQTVLKFSAKFYRRKRVGFFVRLSRNPIFFFFFLHRGKLIPKKRYTLTLLYPLLSIATLKRGRETVKKNNRAKGKKIIPRRASKGTLKKRKKIKHPVALNMVWRLPRHIISSKPFPFFQVETPPFRRGEKYFPQTLFPPRRDR